MATISTLANKILGKKLSLNHKFTVGGIKYHVASYVKFDRAQCIPVCVIRDLTNHTVNVLTITDALGGEVYPTVYGTDLLSSGLLGNGNLAFTSRDYYVELDLINKTWFKKKLLCDDNYTAMVQGTSGHVLIASGTDNIDMHFEWCDPGGGNWDGLQLTTALYDNTFQGAIGSMLASDGNVYMYGSIYGTTQVIAVNVSPLSPAYKTEYEIVCTMAKFGGDYILGATAVDLTNVVGAYTAAMDFIVDHPVLGKKKYGIGSVGAYNSGLQTQSIVIDKYWDSVGGVWVTGGLLEAVSTGESLNPAYLTKLYQTEVGGVGKVVAYAQYPNKFFELDGIAAPVAIATPAAGDYFHSQSLANYEYWFNDLGITVDYSGLIQIPPSEETSINYGGPTLLPANVPCEAGAIDVFSTPHTDGHSLVKGGAYGAIYSIVGDTVTFLGYDKRNAYEYLWSPNHQRWFFIGYDKEITVYDPAQDWDCYQYSTETEVLTTNPSYRPPTVLALSEAHYNSPCMGVDDKVYMMSRGSSRLVWYDLTALTFGYFNIITGGIKLGAASEVIITSPVNNSIIKHITPIRGGHFIAISSIDQDASGGAWVGRLRLFRVLSQDITKILTITGPSTGPVDYDIDIGILVEAGPGLTDNGHVIAVKGNRALTSHAWRINTHAIMPSAVVWDQAITGNAFNLTTAGTSEYCSLEIAPNGLIYLMVGTALKSLNPATGELLTVTVTGGSIPAASRLRWQDNLLFAYGAYEDTNLYPIAGLI